LYEINYTQIAELENVENDTGDQAKKVKDHRGLTIPSKIHPTNSKKLTFSRKQFFRHRKKTLAALGLIHISAADKRKLPQDNKPLLDGLWTTLICTASKPEITTFIRKSNICMQEIIPGIIKGKIKDCKQRKENQVRSLHVLYEGGLKNKRRYTSIRNSSDVVKETGKKNKHQKQNL